LHYLRQTKILPLRGAGEHRPVYPDSFRILEFNHVMNLHAKAFLNWKEKREVQNIYVMYSQVYCSVDGNGLICYKFLVKRCTLTCSSGPSAPLNLGRRHRHFTLNVAIDNATSFRPQTISRASDMRTQQMATEAPSLKKTTEQFLSKRGGWGGG
jgi:hypothetical protein